MFRIRPLIVAATCACVLPWLGALACNGVAPQQGGDGSGSLAGTVIDLTQAERDGALAGGTHVKNTAEIGAFTLTHEEGVAKGVRRVIGISGDAAKRASELGQTLLSEAKAIDNRQSTIDNAALALFQQRLADAEIPILTRRKIQVVLADLQKQAKEQAKEAAADSADAVMAAVRAMLDAVETVGGVTIVVGEVPACGVDALRGAIDWVRNKTPASAVCLASVSAGKVTLIAGMSKTVVEKGVKAGDLIKELAPLIGGKGGGRPDMAQGGGDKPVGVSAALDRARQWITERVS